MDNDESESVAKFESMTQRHEKNKTLEWKAHQTQQIVGPMRRETTIETLTLQVFYLPITYLNLKPGI